MKPASECTELQAPRPSFWRRRIVAPIIAQLTQGVTPGKIALTIAVGFALAIFPILGATTLLCTVAGVLLKLNQPIIQLVNFFAYPAQLALLIPFYRAGESLFGQPHIQLSIPLFFERISADFWQFLRDFGLIALQGIVVWCFIAPPLIAVIYFATSSPLRALARQLQR